MESEFYSSALALAAERLLELRLTRPIRATTPAAGAEWSLIVPGGVVWELFSITETLVTSAVVANRAVSYRIRDADGNTIARYGVSAVQAASTTSVYTVAAGYGISNSIAAQQASLPTPMQPLYPGWSILSATANVDAGDQHSLIFVTVREWSETDIVQEMVELAAQMQSLTEQLVPG